MILFLIGSALLMLSGMIYVVMILPNDILIVSGIIAVIALVIYADFTKGYID